VTSDDIWQQFGIATWRAHRARLRAVAFGCVSLAIVAAALWWAGAFTPQIRWEVNDFGLFAQVDDNGVLSGSVAVELANYGRIPFTLSGISGEMPGLRLLPEDDAQKQAITVQGNRREVFMARVVITDCAAVPNEPQPIHFTYRTWLGSGAAEAIFDSGRLTGSEGSLPIAWQRGLASRICNEAMSPQRP
jgi:hypothetical protein